MPSYSCLLWGALDRHAKSPNIEGVRVAKDKLQALAKDITSSQETDSENRLTEDFTAIETPLSASFQRPTLTKGINWTAIRMDFIMAPQLQTRQALATKYGVDKENLDRRARVEHWQGERTRFRTEMEEKVKSLAANGLAINLIQWDAECLQAARVLMGSAMQELVNGALVKDVHAAIAAAQKVGLEALGRATGEGSHPETQEDVVRVLEDYALAISELSPTVTVEPEATETIQEAVEVDIPALAAHTEDPTKAPVRSSVKPVAAPAWVER